MLQSLELRNPLPSFQQACETVEMYPESRCPMLQALSSLQIYPSCRNDIPFSDP